MCFELGGGSRLNKPGTFQRGQKDQVNRMCHQRGLEDEGQNHNTGNRIHSNSTCGMRGPGRAGARRYLEELQLAVQH